MRMNENAFLKTTCPHCGIHVEYPNEAEGEVAPCPKCGGNVLLKNWAEGGAKRERTALKQVLPQTTTTFAAANPNAQLSLIGRVVIGIAIGILFALGIDMACLLASKMGLDGLGGFMWRCRFRLMDLGIWLVLLPAFIPIFTFFQRKQNQTYKDALREDAMGSCVIIAFVSLFLLTFPFFNAQPQQSKPAPKPVALTQESLKSKAEGGDADAQFKFGSAYFDGVGVAKDQAEAATWWRKAAEQNNASAQYGLGVCYFYGFGVTKDAVEAVNWCRKAAEQGNASAQYLLGVDYDAGEGVGRDDVEAMNWFRKAAEQNFAKAEYRLGNHYSLGSGVTKDDVVAFSWWRKAAEQNDAEAQCQLGDCYSLGQGVALDAVEAVKWYRKAADQNNVAAQCALGNCYEFSFGVIQDYQEAAKLYRLAINNGSEPARDMLKSLQNKMAGIQNPPIPSANIATPQVTATNVSAKVTVANDMWQKWSWKLTLVNHSSDSVNVNTSVQFFDKDGYLVDEDKYGVQNAVLRANSSQSFTGLKMINLPEAKNVVSVGAKVEIQ